MVQLIVGKKGKGKTKCLLDKVNTEVQNVLGNIAFLDKNTKHMYELNNKIRLIVVSDFMISNADEFIAVSFAENEFVGENSYAKKLMDILSVFRR